MRIKSQIAAWLRRRLQVPQIETSLERLRSVGFRPALVFDVGAYQGDFARLCRHEWADVEIACFEVQEKAVESIQEFASVAPPVRVFRCLLGSASAPSVSLHLAETASSVLAEHIPQDFPVSRFPMRTVDEIVAQEFAGRCPALLKLDVQGYELEVLKGAESSLSGIEVLLLEINFLDIHRSVPLHAEVTAWLAARGWVAYDICGLNRRPLDSALWQADFVFAPSNSRLRGDKRWQAK